MNNYLIANNIISKYVVAKDKITDAKVVKIPDVYAIIRDYEKQATIKLIEAQIDGLKEHIEEQHDVKITTIANNDINNFIATDETAIAISYDEIFNFDIGALWGMIEILNDIQKENG